MAFDERDSFFEKALSRHLRRGSPRAACPDEETLAAYHERSLAPEELEQWDPHIASCLRCQAVLSQLESSEHISVAAHIPASPAKEEDVPVLNEPVPAFEELGQFAGAREMAAEEAAPAAPFVVEIPVLQQRRRRTRLRWLVPAGAIAAVLLVWVAVRNTTIEQKPVEIAQRNQQPSPPATSASRPEANSSNALEDGGRMAQLDNRRANKLVEREEAQTKDKLSAKSADESKARAYAPDAIPQPGLSPPGATGSKNAPGAVTAETLPRSYESRTAPSAEAAAAGQERDQKIQAAASSALPAPPAREELPAASDAARGALAAKAVPLVSSDFEKKEAFRLAKTDNTRLVSAPAGKAAWRIGEGGLVLHSSDGGTTWAPQDSGVSDSLLAGSAPSELVCWLVGAHGTILLTMDGGLHWQKLPSPTTATLIGVSARDAQNAAVWSDLRLPRYVTHNAGLTWQQSDTE